MRKANDLYLIASVRRTDWLPVGQDPDGGEQLRRDVESESDDSEDKAIREDEELRDVEDGGFDSEIDDLDDECDDDPETSLRWLGVREGDAGISAEAGALFG